MRTLIVALTLLAAGPALAGQWYVDDYFGDPWAGSATINGTGRSVEANAELAFATVWNRRPAQYRMVNPWAPGVPVWATPDNLEVFPRFVSPGVVNRWCDSYYAATRTSPAPNEFFSLRFVFQGPRC